MIKKDINELFMQRCLDIAKKGLGYVSPNPMVGSIIVHNGKIIGEGYHQKYGSSHAEINAINAVKDKSLLKHSTLYVNFEPCSHYGKTPPCAKKIAELKIPHVVIGIKDLSPKVNGKGIRILKDAGIKVVTGILEKKCYDLNKRFFTFNTKKRPYIILKWAQTQDGFIDIIKKPNQSPNINWITNDVSKSLVHKWRTEESAILIGKNTAQKDNPQLTIREWYGKQPLRVVLDCNLELPHHLHVMDKKIPTVVFNGLKNDNSDSYLLKKKLDYTHPVLPQMMDYFYKNEIQSIIVEGGRKLIQSFIHDGLWDEARVFIGQKYFFSGIKAPEFHYKPTYFEKLLETTLNIYINN